MSKIPISSLPLPSRSHLLTANLTPDPHIPTVAEFRSKVLVNNPSIQRRARLLSPQSHFSYVSPFPLPFPYDIEPPDPTDKVVQDKSKYVEEWLSAREALHERGRGPSLKKLYPENRDQPRELIGLAETGLRDCLPHLDVGDSFATLGVPSLSNKESEKYENNDAFAVSARQDLVDVLSGHATLMSDSEETPFGPWSLRYSGHQFGNWAGQLGDGRATSILVTPHPSDPNLTYELQLKGSGRTPFSRTADGLAVLRSSIREFLGAEAIRALNIPTTRSLALISLPSLRVIRERVETACVLTRVAPSFLRIGSFEAFNPPANMFFFGGGQQEAHWDGLRALGEWVANRVLGIGIEQGWARKLVLEVARRNAQMVAGWQAYGFMHGVINTDNVSVLGLTIDYGPYAFMDVFDPWHICNHTDEEGRYAYRSQPEMIVYALRALLNALAPLIGAGLDSEIKPGWADDIPSAKIDEWRKKGLESTKDEMERVIQEVSSVEYGRLMRKRLGLRFQNPRDESQITKPLLDLLEKYRLDFHGSFRALTFFRPSLLTQDASLEKFVTHLLSLRSDTTSIDHAEATQEWLVWLEKYAARIESERAEWPGEDADAQREKEARAANPRFVLRQWVLEEVIKKVEEDAESGKRILAKVLQMSCNPYEPWGAEGDVRLESELEPEIREERRFCGMGEKKMLGFQCSCSS